MKPWAPNYSRFIADCPAGAGKGGEWDADEDGRCWIPCYVSHALFHDFLPQGLCSALSRQLRGKSRPRSR